MNHYRTTYRLAMTTETVLLTVLFSTLYASTLAPRWMFAVWVWLIYLTFPGMIYRVVQKNSIMFESSRPLSAQCPRQPMNSPSALTEHVSLNLAGIFLLDLVTEKSGWRFN